MLWHQEKVHVEYLIIASDSRIYVGNACVVGCVEHQPISALRSVFSRRAKEEKEENGC